MLVDGQQVRDEDKVEFNAVDGDRGKQATDISRID
jgi:cold shock CspA family protein